MIISQFLLPSLFFHSPALMRFFRPLICKKLVGVSLPSAAISAILLQRNTLFLFLCCSTFYAFGLNTLSAKDELSRPLFCILYAKDEITRPSGKFIF